MSDSDGIERLNAALEGRYVIERELGEGGMATVYLADDLKHERKVAVKVLKPELAAVVGAERFLTEIKVTANLQHPNILPLFDSGEADSFLFYVMPYVQGETLADRINQEKQLPVDEAVRLATAVAGALDHAHRAGVVHRDIKPANILLQDGQPVVADFGIALAVGAAGSGRRWRSCRPIGSPRPRTSRRRSRIQDSGTASWRAPEPASTATAGSGSPWGSPQRRLFLRVYPPTHSYGQNHPSRSAGTASRYRISRHSPADLDPGSRSLPTDPASSMWALGRKGPGRSYG